MGIASLLFFSLLVLCVCLAVVVSLKPKWLEITYVEWSRSKKAVFAISCGTPLLISSNGSLMALSILFIFSMFMALERQKTFVSIRLRT
jgi:hypothetical protein